MHALSRGPGLAAEAVCTTFGLSQVAARQFEPTFAMQPYNLILQLHCESFTASQTYRATCIGRTGWQYSSRHLGLLLNIREFTGREHFGPVR
jgi:hypothetical protein